MATKIEWATTTWNPVTGCTKISAGCKNCYAKRMSKRLAGRFGYPADDPFKVTLHSDRFSQPRRWRKPRRVFVCSMGDLFHPAVWQGWIDSVFHVMHKTPRHTYFLLTKRPERMKEWIDLSVESDGTVEIDVGIGYSRFRWPLPNVWLGVTAENQARADERIPILLQIPAAVRFVSVEPMLGAIDVNAVRGAWEAQQECGTTLDWIICGAETGPGARPMSLDWARSLRDQCQAAGVDFFFKRDSDGNRTLDGVMWEQYPGAMDG